MTRCRQVWLVASFGLLLVALPISGCGSKQKYYNFTVSKADFEAQATPQLLAAAHGHGKLKCPDRSVPAARNMRVSCTWTKDGETRTSDVTIAVTSVDEVNKSVQLDAHFSSWYDDTSP